MYGKQKALGAFLLAAGLAVPFGQVSLQGNTPTHDGWNVVTEGLEPGGTVYMYLDTEVILEEFITGVSDLLGMVLMHQPMNPMAGMELDELLTTILGRVGILDVKAAGVSTVKMADGQGNRVRSVLYMGEKRGFFSLLDVDAERRADLSAIPPSSVIVFSGWNRFDNIMPMVRDLAALVTEISGEDVDFDGQLAKIGFDPDRVFNSLTGEFTNWVALGDSVTIPLDEMMPGTPPLVVPEVYGYFSYGTKDDTIFQLLQEAFGDHDLVDADASTDARITFREVEQSPFSTQFIIEQQADKLVIVSSPNALMMSNAARAGENITTDPLFARLAAGMPESADSINYVDPRLYNEVLNIISHPMASAFANDPNMAMSLDFWKSTMEIENGTFTARDVTDRGLHWFQQGEVSSTSGLQVMLLPALLPVLAAIAVPNFLEAQTRSKVSRTRMDMRSMATALETYYVDNNSYPAWTNELDKSFNAGYQGVEGIPTFRSGGVGGPMTLTTPIAYLVAPFEDVFSPDKGATFGYLSSGAPQLDWIIFSPGPNRRFDIDPNQWRPGGLEANRDWLLNATYDPTNGTVSAGDIWRIRQ
ncbi:MAG: type II secretion system protein GspG [Candidatus Sumerlaeia bacterium]|nr:type II secretion system protein GspG [Candidatus Sumerlaeia bacterium]